MQLQKGPIALLGAFALKVLGRNPTAFGDSITPVVDVYDQYLAAGELQVSNQVLATALAAFNSSTFTVPNGKAWRVKGASLLGSLNAADAAFVSMQTVNIQSPNSSPNGCRIAAAQFPATAGPRAVGYVGPPIFLPSGWKIVLELWTSAAITVTSNLQATVFFQEIDT
jgi:hypothetical protein